MAQLHRTREEDARTLAKKASEEAAQLKEDLGKVKLATLAELESNHAVALSNVQEKLQKVTDNCKTAQADLSTASKQMDDLRKQHELQVREQAQEHTRQMQESADGYKKLDEQYRRHQTDAAAARTNLEEQDRKRQ